MVAAVALTGVFKKMKVAAAQNDTKGYLGANEGPAQAVDAQSPVCLSTVIGRCPTRAYEFHQSVSSGGGATAISHCHRSSHSRQWLCTSATQHARSTPLQVAPTSERCT